MGGGEFFVLLLCHLDLISSLTNFNSFLVYSLALPKQVGRQFYETARLILFTSWVHIKDDFPASLPAMWGKWPILNVNNSYAHHFQVWPYNPSNYLSYSFFSICLLDDKTQSNLGISHGWRSTSVNLGSKMTEWSRALPNLVRIILWCK